LGQTYRPTEIILINDGSTDETPQVLDQLAAENPDVIRVIHKENEGPGLARETGRLAAQGEFIQYLDSDDWLLPRKFEIQVKALRDHPECKIAYGKSRFVSDKGEVIQEPSKWTGRKMECLFPALLVDRWWHTHTPLYRRSVSDAAGAWPKQRPEDWDLESRMGALKAKLVYCDAVLSCQLAHSGLNRVSEGPIEQYIMDEAWFLPRLYKCARKAGIKKSTPEMQHFSRRAFYLARQLGEMGRVQRAYEMMDVAQRSSLKPLLSLYLYLLAVRIFGWKTMGRCSGFAVKLLGRKSGKNTLAGSWNS